MTGFYVEHDRDVVYVRGSDARKFLHSQLANDVASLKVGKSQYSLLLEPTGKITSLLRVHCKSDEDFVLDCDSGFGEVSATRLSRFKIRIKCEISSGAQRFVAVRGLSANNYADFLARNSALAAWRESDCAVDFVASEFVAGDLRQGQRTVVVQLPAATCHCSRLQHIDRRVAECPGDIQ